MLKTLFFVLLPFFDRIGYNVDGKMGGTYLYVGGWTIMGVIIPLVVLGCFLFAILTAGYNEDKTWGL
jgi:hypothetical protein